MQYTVPNIGQLLKLTISGHNRRLNSSSTCSGNPVGVMYAVTTADCVGGVGQLYNSATCQYENCEVIIIGCLSCVDASTCSGCDSPLNFQLSAANKCECIPGYGYLSANNSCVPCKQYLPGCAMCSTLQVCTICNSTGNFQLKVNDPECECMLGYAFDAVLADCHTVCGDGYVRHP
jgi:hypothetical protein